MIKNLLPKAPPPAVIKAVGAVQNLLVQASRKLAPAQFALLDVVGSKWKAFAIELLANHDLAEPMRHGPRSVADLAAHAGLHEPSLYRVLRALASEGFLAEGPPRHFRLTPITEPLLKDHPSSIHFTVRQMGSAWSRATWAQFDASVKDGAPAFPKLYGGDLWSFLGKNPDAAEIFNRSMVELTRSVVDTMAAAYDFGALSALVDLGGGSGALISGLLRHYPSLRGMVYDLGPALTETDAELTRAGLRDRCDIREGNVLEAAPPGFDGYLLKNILHGFSDEDNARCLRAVREAMSPTSRLFIIEVVVPEDGGPYFQFLDLQMLVGSGGKERTATEYRQLLAANGLTIEQILPTASPMSLIVARPA